MRELLDVVSHMIGGKSLLGVFLPEDFFPSPGPLAKLRNEIARCWTGEKAVRFVGIVTRDEQRSWFILNLDQDDRAMVLDPKRENETSE